MLAAAAAATPSRWCAQPMTPSQLDTKLFVVSPKLWCHSWVMRSRVLQWHRGDMPATSLYSLKWCVVMRWQTMGTIHRIRIFHFHSLAIPPSIYTCSVYAKLCVRTQAATSMDFPQFSSLPHLALDNFLPFSFRQSLTVLRQKPMSDKNVEIKPSKSNWTQLCCVAGNGERVNVSSLHSNSFHATLPNADGLARATHSHTHTHRHCISEYELWFGPFKYDS